MWSVPPPPRRPSPLAKRLIYRYAGDRLVKLILGLAFSVVGLPCLYLCHDLPGQLALDLHRTSTSGTVTQAHVDYGAAIDGEHPTEVQFQYEVDGRTYVAATTFFGTRPQAFPSGEEVRVEFVPWRPRWARVMGGTYSTFPLWSAILLVFPLVATTFLVSAIGEKRRSVRAFRDGVPTTGYVVFAGPDTKTKINGNHPHKVEWLFQVHGNQFRGQLSHMDARLLAAFQLGSSVPVLYLPRNPGVNTLWVDVGQR